MNSIELLLNQPWAARLGWTLIHFFWQGTLIAVLFAAARAMAGRWMGPGARYRLACLALAAMMAAPALTFLAVGAPDSTRLLAPLGRAGGADWERSLPWLVLGWIAGVVAFSIRLAAGWRWTRRLRRVAVSPVAGEWQRALDELIRLMRVAAPVRLLASSLADAPAVVGWLRPLILMPVEALASLPAEHVRALLAHELAHIRRHDYLTNILQSIGETILFYHPAVWWVSAQIRAEREVCCDELAVAAIGDRLVYATALTDLDTGRRARLATALAASGGSLVNRIRRLLGEAQPDSHNLPGPGVAWALSLLWLAGVGAAALHSAPTAPERSIGVAHRLFVARSAIKPAPVLPDPPPAASAPMAPVLSALLYDPLFKLPLAPAPPAAAAPAPQATLEGRVVNALDGTPLAGARVQMAPVSVSGEPAYAKADAQGHFQFPNLTLGHYSLNAEQPGFLRTHERRNSPGGFKLVDLVPPAAGPSGFFAMGTFEMAGLGTLAKSLGMDGVLRATVTIPLTPYAVIAGKVTEPNGYPRNNCPVAIQSKENDVLKTVLTAYTDDRGEYRAARLAPGTYYVMADKAGLWPSTLRVYRATYFPAALDAASATPIVLTAGQQSRADIRLRQTPGVSVTGRVAIPSDAGDSSTRVLLAQPEIAPAQGRAFAQAADGQFELKNVMPGKYTLMALTRANTADGKQGKPLAAALQQVEVGDQDLGGLEVDLQPLLDLPGTVSFAQGCAPVAVRVVAFGNSWLGPSRAEAVADTGSDFTLSGLISSKHRLTVMVPSGYWATAQLGDRDALKDGFYYPAPEGETLRIAVNCAENGSAR